MKHVTYTKKQVAIGIIPIVLVALMVASTMTSGVQMNGLQISQVLAKMQKTEGHEENRMQATQSTTPTPVSNVQESAPSTISQDGGGDVTAQLILTGFTLRPSENIAGAKGFYDVVFKTTTAGAVKSIVTSFPGGTGMPTSGFLNEAEKCLPNSACTVLTGDVTRSGNVLRFTISGTPPVLPAGTKIRIEYAGFTNPPPGSYVITGSTRNVANNFIDGPTQSTPYIIISRGTIPSAVFGAIGPDVTLASGATGSSTATCPAGSTATGGGIHQIVGSLIITTNDSPGGNSWTVEAFNHGGAGATFHAHAACMNQEVGP